MDNHHAINREINYFYDHFPLRKLFVYQMIFHDMFPGFSHDHPYEITEKIPMIIPWSLHHYPMIIPWLSH